MSESREMNLDEYIGKLTESHRAATELRELRAAVDLLRNENAALTAIDANETPSQIVLQVTIKGPQKGFRSGFLLSTNSASATRELLYETLKGLAERATKAVIAQYMMSKP
jgi:hypothetical protein